MVEAVLETIIVDANNNVVGNGFVLSMETIICMVFLVAVGNGTVQLHLPAAVLAAALVVVQVLVRLAVDWVRALVPALVLVLVRVRVLPLANGHCHAMPTPALNLWNAYGI